MLDHFPCFQNINFQDKMFTNQCNSQLNTAVVDGNLALTFRGFLNCVGQRKFSDAAEIENKRKLEGCSFYLSQRAAMPLTKHYT